MSFLRYPYDSFNQKGNYMENYGFWLENLHTQDAALRSKLIEEKRLEAIRTRKQRVFEILENDLPQHKKFEPVDIRVNLCAYNYNGWFNRVFDLLYTQEDATEVNREIAWMFTCLREDMKNWKGQIWAPLDGHLNVMSIYLCFGRNGTVCPGKLSREASDALLAYVWDLMEIPNDIHFARDSTWYIDGSENHDLGHKAASLISSMIFMDEPDYCNRIYPNLGTGYNAGEKSPMSACRKKSIYGDYTPRDQYKAWVEFFEIYFRDRAKKGFFLERASNYYMRWTLSVIFSIYNFVKDAHLKETTRKFLDLIWADWATEQINGIRGGIKARHHYSAGENDFPADGKQVRLSDYYDKPHFTDAMNWFAAFLLGGYSRADMFFRAPMLGDYEIPKPVWHMIFSREEMGRFTYLSRGIAEENPVLPRPAGSDFRMMADVPQRCVRVSYVTPSYILAMPHEHPRMLYNHLAVSGRWMGLIVGDTVRARIVPIALDPPTRLSGHDGEKYHTDLICRGVQYENVQIFQQDRAFQQGGPNMFPVYDDHANQPMGLYIGDGWDEKLEKDGVLFLRKGKTYASVRIILIKQDADPLAWAKGTGKFCNEMTMDEEPYTWENEEWLRLKSKFSPVIVEAGEEKDFDGFEEFVQKILNNPPELTPTVVPREAGVVIRYKGLSASAKELMYNSANKDEIPLIGGEIIDYEYGYTFDSPWFKSKYDSGIAEISFGGETLTLDFN